MLPIPHRSPIAALDAESAEVLGERQGAVMKLSEMHVTETGGRTATTRHIPPKLALAVGKPATPPPEGWRWSALTDLARLESGHTPSRKCPEYWGGGIPWISIGDARAHDGRRIDDTEEKTNALPQQRASSTTSYAEDEKGDHAQPADSALIRWRT